MENAVVHVTSAGGRERALQLWASRGGTGSGVERLNAALGDVKSVLTEAQGREIQNEALVRVLKEAWHVASRGDDLRSELEYYRIQEELQRDERKDDDDKLVHGNASQMNNFLLRLPGGETHLFNVDVSQPAEDTREKSAFSTEDSSLAALQIVPFVANPMVPASNTSLEPHLELLDSADFSCEINEHIEGCCRMASDLRMALKLENLDYRIVQKCQSTRTDPRHTSSYPTESKVYGRDQERDLIISRLTSEESAGRNLSVLAIVGNGGVGKTTLAQVVFNDSAVSKHFDILLWDYVSVHFDRAKIMHELLESLLGDRHENIKGLKELQDILEYAFKSKRVLLVLDDMWEDSQKENWDELLTPLLSNDVKGNKVLVTTRKPSVANLIGATDHINLDGLNPDDFWCLFKAFAFGDENYKGERKLEKIGRKIIVKLKGNPLAAKSVGKVLRRSRDVDHWTRVLDNSEWKDNVEDDDIMPALMISYKYLPVHLQQCFSYCAVFPKYHRYERERLINIWIAQGLICSTDMRRRVEDIGSDFFNDLVEWGFFQKDFGISTLLIMHDLIHDLAQKVSSDESFTIEGNEPRDAPRLVRHASIITKWKYKTDLDGTVHPNEPFLQEFSNSFGKLQRRNLSTLMLFGPHDLDFANTFRQEFSEVKSVRVLKLEMAVFDLDSLIGNISAFINLRYLELGCFYEGPRLELPEAICMLYHLQVLDIKKNWGTSTVLPRGMNKLVNLRHFIAEEKLHAKIASIGNMVSLQELKVFGVRNASEFNISQLRRLNQIRGSISIYNLNYVGSQEEAIEARICDKVHLATLHLSWYGVSGRRVGRKRDGSSSILPILEDLKPHEGLVNLRIEAYRHPVPSWLSSNVHLTSLRSLHLDNCLRWGTIPHPQQLPLLRELHLMNLGRVFEIEIGRLEILELRRLPNLRQCIVLDMEQSSANLRVLEVEDCPRLEGFPLQPFISSDMQSEYQFTGLRRLQIHTCPCHTSISNLLLIDSLEDIDLWCVSSKFEKFRLGSLGASNGLRMEIKGNRYVSRIEERLFTFDKLRNLLELEINNYPSLTYLAWEGFQQLASLKKLKMIRCCKLFSSNCELSMPPSIEELEFHWCNITGKQLSQVLLNLPLLKNLNLTNCQEVTSLPVGLFTDEHSQMAQASWYIPPNCLTTLEKLQISFERGSCDVGNSTMHFSSEQGFGIFISLKKIVVKDCPTLLSTVISGGVSDIPASSLVKLYVTDIKDSLLQFSEVSSLLELDVEECRSLTCVNLHYCTALEKLCIRGCGLLWSLEGLQSCKALRHLSIYNCKVLHSLRASLTLTTLNIQENPNLAYVNLHSCMALQKLCIEGCPAVASWEGVKSLIGLEYLKVENSPGFTSSWISASAEVEREHNYFLLPLQVLDIDDIGVLCMPLCSRLTSLKTLIIHGARDARHGYVDVLTDNHEKALLLLTSLTHLEFVNFEHLRSLPAELQSLTSLQRLTLNNCERITSLPVGGLPASLKDMELYCCSEELNALCREMRRVQKLYLWVNGTEDE